MKARFFHRRCLCVVMRCILKASYRLRFLVVLLTSALVWNFASGIRPLTIWLKATESDVAAVKSLRQSKVQFTYRLFWESKDGIHELSLSEAERGSTARLLAELKPARDEQGVFEAETILCKLILEEPDNRGDVFEFAICKSNRAFASFHAKQKYDHKKRCFEHDALVKHFELLMSSDRVRKKPHTFPPPPK